MSSLSLVGFSRIPAEFIETSQETFNNNYFGE
jgi:hypothetical protein